MGVAGIKYFADDIYAGFFLIHVFDTVFCNTTENIQRWF